MIRNNERFNRRVRTPSAIRVAHSGSIGGRINNSTKMKRKLKVASFIQTDACAVADARICPNESAWRWKS